MIEVRYCLPVIERCTADVKRRLSEDNSSFTCIEIWIDYIEDLHTEMFNALDPTRAIIVSRRLNADAPTKPYSSRMALLHQLIERRFIVDLDLVSQRRELEELSPRSRKRQLLLSYHNYRETPPDSELESILLQMNELTPYIRKIATFCNSDQDATRLLNLLVEHKPDGNITMQGMGDLGIPVRVFGSLMGNFLTYAPKTRENASAPGQLTHSEFVQIFQELSHGR